MIKYSKKLSILKDKNKKKEFLKFELKKLIFKSIIQNKNNKPVLRAFCNYKLSKLNLKHTISKQNNNICLKTGKIKSTLKLTKLSRHYMKKIAINGFLQNFKINNW